MIKEEKKVAAIIEVSFIDANKGKVDVQQSLSSLKPEVIVFDFNSKKDFSPDTDSVRVAKKFWTWFLSPLQYTDLKPAQCLYISRSNAAREEKASDDDSYGSEESEEDEVKFTYDQQDPMDKMIKEYLTGKIGSTNA